jgi:cobalamin biosynthesis protein CbiG
MQSRDHSDTKLSGNQRYQLRKGSWADLTFVLFPRWSWIGTGIRVHVKNELIRCQVDSELEASML